MPKVNEEEEETPGGIAPGTMVDGRYKVVRAIGHGGNGLVHEVEHILTGRRLALKSLIDESGLARLEQEARASSLMKNVHTAKITDMGTSGPLGPYLVMELLDGQSLRDLLDEAGQLPLEITINIALQVCECLTEAHGHGIVHRDLKPENIFLCPSPWPGQYEVKVLDFGIVKIAVAGPIPQSSLTRTGSTVGTPYYMSLEQLRNSSAVDARADVYSLGVVLYECLSGRKPFLADTIGDLVYALCSGPPTHLGRIRPDLPAEVCDVVMRTLNMDRDERPANMSDLATALLPFGNSAFGLWMQSHSRPPSIHVEPPPLQPSGSTAPSTVKDTAAPKGAPPSKVAAPSKVATPSKGAESAAGPLPTIPKRPPMPSPTSTEFEAPAEIDLDEVTNANSSPTLANSEQSPDSDRDIEAESSNETATMPRPRMLRPSLEAEARGRDTPTEMYQKDGAAKKEASGASGGERDTPTNAVREAVGGPRDRAFVETLPTPFSPAERNADRNMEPGSSAQGLPFNIGGAPSAEGSALASDATWATRHGSSPSLPTLTPRGLMQNPPFGASPSVFRQSNPLLSTMPMPTLDRSQLLELPVKPRWQVVLDRSLIRTGNFIEDKLRRFRATSTRVQFGIQITAAGVGLVLLSLLIYWWLFS
jgi:serine/threonine protein kinase